MSPTPTRCRRESITDSTVATGKGDDGTTGLWYGGRVDKSDLRTDAYGTLDEACSELGIARALCGPGQSELAADIGGVSPQSTAARWSIETAWPAPRTSAPSSARQRSAVAAADHLRTGCGDHLDRPKDPDDHFALHHRAPSLTLIMYLGDRPDQGRTSVA